MQKKIKKLFLPVFSSAVIAVSIPAHADPLQNKRTDSYLQSLALTKNYAELRSVLQAEIAATDKKDIARLIQLAQYGTENNLRGVAASAYEIVLKNDPDNLTAKRNMGLIMYADGKYESALKFFREYNSRTGGDYNTSFSQAELMHLMRKRISEKAEPFFEKALLQASRMGDGIKGAEIVRAKSLFRLGKHDEASSVFENLEKKYPDDVYVVLDYAGMLYDAGLLENACRQLEKLPENMYGPECLKSFRLDKQQTAEVTVRVMTIRIAYELSKKNYFTVKKMLKELDEHYPDRADVAMSKASYYSSYRNLRGELDSVRQALNGYPEDETLLRSEEQLSRLHGSFIQNEFGVRLSDNNGVELLNQSKLEMRIVDDLKLGINYTVDVANLHDVPRMDGTEKDFHGVRTMAEIFLQGDFINGDSARLSFFDQDGIAGVGGWYKLLDYWGHTILKGAWREPYWLEQQAIAEKGSRTYLQLGREYRPFDCLTLSAAASMNSYGLKDSQDLTRSVGINSKVEYKLPQIELQRKWLGEHSLFTTNYEFNYEQFFDHESNDDGTRKYNPGNIQVHSFCLGYANQFTDDLRGSLSAGYAYDAVGKGPASGPIYNASLAYMITKKLEISANVGQVISSNKYFYTGLALKYSFMPDTLVEFLTGKK